MKPAAILIRELSKTFPAAGLSGVLGRSRATKPALECVDMDVVTGEIVGLLGPNGAGKTTLLEILATLLLPSEGEARICGCDAVKDAAEVRGMVGYCPAATESFYPRLTARENLEFFALINDLSAAEAKIRIATLIELVGLNDSANAAFQKLSQGMKQRLALARALLTDPPVLLLDEPSKSLDPLLQKEIWRLLRGVLADEMGKTILIVTHSLAEVEAVCDRMAILKDGRIVCEGPVEHVRASLGGDDLGAAFERAVLDASSDINARRAP